MRKLLHCLFISINIILILQPGSVYSQTDKENGHDSKCDRNLDPENIDIKLLSSCVLDLMNNYRVKNGAETFRGNDILEKAADLQAQYMSRIEEVTLENKKKVSTTAKRVILYGGGRNVDEIVNKTNAVKGNEFLSYQAIAQDLINKFTGNKKSEVILLDPKWIFAGIGAGLDASGKKLFVSVVFGNHYSFNEGAKRIEMLTVPYTTKSMKLTPYDKVACKKCDRMPNLEDLYKGVILTDDNITFKTDDLRTLKKILKESKDGFAIDIVQKEQYDCSGPAVVDNTLINKGVLLKPVYKKNLYKYNIYAEQPKVKLFETPLGKIPDNITGDYELNLLIIQNGRVCKTITKNYIDKGIPSLTMELKLLRDSNAIKIDSQYVPSAESTTITFRIPFEKNKYTYKQEDIEPFLKALNEPDFTINEVLIAAYSSIEGNDADNQKLQQKRAESINDALKLRQKLPIKTTITTSNNWEQFSHDFENTKWKELSSLDAKQANDHIIQNNLHKQIEPILAKHRYAEIVMVVTYEILGPKEQFFVTTKFRRAVEKDDPQEAFAIQQYIIKQVLAKKYSHDAITDMVIPDGKAWAPHLTNKIVMELIIKEKQPNDDQCKSLEKIYNYDRKNTVYSYNRLACAVVNTDFTSVEQINNMQSSIDELYNNTKLTKEMVDAMNLELQFKALTAADSLDPSGNLTLRCYDKVKSIVKIKETTWNNALQLSYLFLKYKDYEYAARVLETYLGNKNISAEYLFTYMSVCTHSQSRVMSNRFANAAERASKLDRDRFCKLFNTGKASFQMMDNPFVKDSYCKACR
jgi:uncharacterized protein YkwD